MSIAGISSSYWVCIAPEDFVGKSVDLGILQMCELRIVQMHQGKRDCLGKMSAGDGIVFFASDSRRFVAIGEIAYGQLYQTHGGFKLFRRDVLFNRDAQQVDVRGLAGRLTEKLDYWEKAFPTARKISKSDFRMILAEMGALVVGQEKKVKEEEVEEEEVEEVVVGTVVEKSN